MSPSPPKMSDAERESLIDITTQLAINGKSFATRSYWDKCRCELVRGRSPEQIRRLEIERGLLRGPNPQQHQKISIAKFLRPDNSAHEPELEC